MMTITHEASCSWYRGRAHHVNEQNDPHTNKLVNSSTVFRLVGGICILKEKTKLSRKVRDASNKKSFTTPLL